MNKQLLKQTEWELDALLPKYKSAAHDAFVKSISTLLDEIISKRSQLTDTIAIPQFKSLIAQLEELSFKLSKLSVHAHLLYSKNVKDETAKLYVAFVEDFGADISNKLLYFEQWYIRLPSAKAKQLADSLGNDAHSFHQKYEHGKHVLSEAEEKIINLKDITGASAHVKLYDTITSGWTFNYDGKKQSLSQISKYLQNADRKKRKEADELIHKKYVEYEDVLGDIYVALTKDYDTEEVKLRKYKTPLHVRTQSEEISVAAVQALFDAVKSQQKVFHNFFALKAKLMGLKKLESYDMSAPLSKKKTEKIPYAIAMTKVYDAINKISPRFLSLVEKMVLANHIDSVFHKNKQRGAYNCGLPNGIMPYVFMQYLGERTDMFTIVHELGHSVHSMHMNKYNSFTADAPIAICESVSTFFEEILFEEELALANPVKKKELLAWKLTDLFASISNGAFVSNFEVIAHDLVSNGATHQEISKQWTKLKKEQLGTAVITRPHLTGWMGIPHIYQSPFYYYNYAVGNLIALLFLQQFKRDPVTFRKRFEKYLSVGGTLGTVETLAVMGIDVEDKKTWESAFVLIHQRVSQLNSLLSK